MNVRHTLICLFFLSLQDGNIGLVEVQISVITGIEGEDLRVICPFSSTGYRGLFCKEQCSQEKILIDTPYYIAQSGRYTFEYKELNKNVFVSISQLTKSDSGRYRCGLLGSEIPYIDFEIMVVDALLNRDSSEEKTLHTRTGGNIIVACSFTRSERRKYFCRGECNRKDILVETTEDRAQSDRYSIRFAKESQLILYVSIEQLIKTDSGRYRCGLDSPLLTDPYREFRIIVTDALTTPHPNLTLPTTTQSVRTSSGGSTPPNTETTSTRDVVLFVFLTLLVTVLLLLSVLIFCRRKFSKAKEPPVETEFAVTEANQLYENIGEERRGRSPPLENSSVYTYVKYSKPHGAETNNDYSSITAANSQNTAEDDSDRLIYSEVNFSNRAAGSSNIAHRHGDDDQVVYSDPRVEASSGASRAEDDLPVYSTVNKL